MEFIGLMTIGSASASHSAAEQQKNPDFEAYPYCAVLTIDADYDQGEIDEGDTRSDGCRTKYGDE